MITRDEQTGGMLQIVIFVVLPCPDALLLEVTMKSHLLDLKFSSLQYFNTMFLSKTWQKVNLFSKRDFSLKITMLRKLRVSLCGYLQNVHTLTTAQCLGTTVSRCGVFGLFLFCTYLSKFQNFVGFQKFQNQSVFQDILSSFDFF